jgi:ubiquinone/menaquinone biosynthesis C-methylase UbiE
MGFYERRVLPRLIDLVMRNRAARADRAKYVPLATGIVLEVGIGSALNLPFYGSGVERLYALDPSAGLWEIGRRRAASAPFPVEFRLGSGERIPLPDSAVDTVVLTWTLCSVPEPLRALREIKRVLRAAGRLIFVEHGRAPDAGVVAWQDRLTPLWRRVAGGCHLNRKIDDLIRGVDFDIERLEVGYSEGPRPFGYLYRGVARFPGPSVCSEARDGVQSRLGRSG